MKFLGSQWSRLGVLTVTLVACALVATPRVSAHFGSPHIVCIDAGHGYNDPGASWYGLAEADQTLLIAQQLKQLLTTLDTTTGYDGSVNVVMTRADAGSPTGSFGNTERANVCNDGAADTIVSIHLNSTASASTTDYAKPFYGKQNKDKALADTLKANYRLPLPAGSTYGTGLLTVNSSGQFASGLLLKTNGAASLFETLFISNQAEANALAASQADPTAPTPSGDRATAFQWSARLVRYTVVASSSRTRAASGMSRGSAVWSSAPSAPRPTSSARSLRHTASLHAPPVVAGASPRHIRASVVRHGFSHAHAWSFGSSTAKPSPRAASRRRLSAERNMSADLPVAINP